MEYVGNEYHPHLLFLKLVVIDLIFGVLGADLELAEFDVS